MANNKQKTLEIKVFNRFCRSTLYPITYSCWFGHKFSFKKCPSIALVRPKFLRGVITVLRHCASYVLALWLKGEQNIAWNELAMIKCTTVLFDIRTIHSLSGWWSMFDVNNTSPWKALPVIFIYPFILLLPTQERGYKIVHHISDGEKRKTQLHYSFPCTQSWRGCFGGCNQPIEADDKVKWILPQTSSISYLNCKHKTSSFKGVQKTSMNYKKQSFKFLRESQHTMYL